MNDPFLVRKLSDFLSRALSDIEEKDQKEKSRPPARKSYLRIWMVIDRPLTAHEICDRLGRPYNSSLRKTLLDMVREGYLVRLPGWLYSRHGEGEDNV